MPGARRSHRTRVGIFFDLASLTSGETVVDWAVGRAWTPSTPLTVWDRRVASSASTSPSNKLEKARKLAAGAGADQVEFIEGRIESLLLGDASEDCVISNGVIHLAPEQERRVRRSAAGAAPG